MPRHRLRHIRQSGQYLSLSLRNPFLNQLPLDRIYSLTSSFPNRRNSLTISLTFGENFIRKAQSPSLPRIKRICRQIKSSKDRLKRPSLIKSISPSLFYCIRQKAKVFGSIRNFHKISRLSINQLTQSHSLHSLYQNLRVYIKTSQFKSLRQLNCLRHLHGDLFHRTQ